MRHIRMVAPAPLAFDKPRTRRKSSPRRQDGLHRRLKRLEPIVVLRRTRKAETAASPVRQRAVPGPSCRLRDPWSSSASAVVARCRSRGRVGGRVGRVAAGVADQGVRPPVAGAGRGLAVAAAEHVLAAAAVEQVVSRRAGEDVRTRLPRAGRRSSIRARSRSRRASRRRLRRPGRARDRRSRRRGDWRRRSSSSRPCRRRAAVEPVVAGQSDEAILSRAAQSASSPPAPAGCRCRRRRGGRSAAASPISRSGRSRR